MKIGFAIAAGMLLASTAADAITYIGQASGPNIDVSGPAGTATVNYAIRTDGTIGVVSNANIVDFSITIDVNGIGATTSGIGTLTNSGGLLSATPTQLLFDYKAFAGSFDRFVIFDAASNQGLCFTNLASLCAGFGPVMAWFNNSGRIAAFQSKPLGSAVIGTAVPEPASWAMLIAGFGLTGLAFRRRRVVQTA